MSVSCWYTDTWFCNVTSSLSSSVHNSLTARSKVTTMGSRLTAIKLPIDRYFACTRCSRSWRVQWHHDPSANWMTTGVGKNNTDFTVWNCNFFMIYATRTLIENSSYLTSVLFSDCLMLADSVCNSSSVTWKWSLSFKRYLTQWQTCEWRADCYYVFAALLFFKKRNSTIVLNLLIEKHTTQHKTRHYSVYKNSFTSMKDVHCNSSLNDPKWRIRLFTVPKII